MKHPEKILLAVSAAVVLASAAAFGWLTWKDRGRLAPVDRVQLAGAAYQASGVDAPSVKTESWDLPVPQPRGRGWVYDVFSPPEIFYNARTKQFSVTPPAGTGDEVLETAFGLELVSVRREPFRLQLIGYVGGEGNYRGTFENKRSGEVFLAAAGRRVPDLALVIKRFEVRNEVVAMADSMSTHQRVAFAVVHDDRSGRDIVLTHRERRFDDGLFAIVAADGETAPREVRAGDTFKTAAGTYRIDKVQFAPPAVEVSKQIPDLPQPDRRTLTPRADADDVAVADQPSH